MKFRDFLFLASTAGCLAGLTTASAHISVGGDRTLNAGSPIDGLTVNNNLRTVSSSFGWADATDLNWGDSHRLTAFKFTLASTQTVSLTVARRNAIGQTGAVDALLPAFSLFTIPGAFVASTHDASVPTGNYLTGLFGNSATGDSFVNTNGNGGYEVGDPFVDSNLNTVWDNGEQFIDVNGAGIWETGDPFTDANGNGVFDGPGLGGSGKEGAFRALSPWKIFTDAPALEMNFSTLIGHAADGTSANYGNASGINGDGNADGTVSTIFTDLIAGDYYLFVGGADYLAQNTDTLPGGTSFRSYGIDVTISATPEPTSMALLAMCAVGASLSRHPRSHRPCQS